MQTLITDPFEDDVYNPGQFIQWAYGVDARVFFSNAVNYGFQRIGQSFMNTLRRYDHKSYQRLVGTSGDSFFDDSRIPLAIETLTSK